MRHVIEVSCPVPNSFRVQQVASMFDVTLAERSVKRFEVDLPAIDDTWDIGLIVGPSGTGKSTIAREIMGEYLYKPPRWPRNEAIIAVARRMRCVTLRELQDELGTTRIPHAFGPYCWVLSDVVRLPSPIAIAGKLSLWNVPESIARRIARSIE